MIPDGYDKDYSRPLKVGDWVMWDNDDPYYAEDRASHGLGPVRITRMRHNRFYVDKPFAWDETGMHEWLWSSPMMAKRYDPIDELIESLDNDQRPRL